MSEAVIKPKGKTDTKEARINREIIAPQVRLIGPDGTQIGIVSIKKALAKAEEVELDLVEIAPQAKPPVCRLMDYGKYRYELSKKEKDARKKQHTVQVKGIRLTPTTDAHDFEFKAEAARRFLESGAKVKVSVIFKGRLIAHKEFGEQILKRFQEKLEDIAKVESPAKMEGMRNMVLLLSKK
jgi:translation initiation factor IF-3